MNKRGSRHAGDIVDRLEADIEAHEDQVHYGLSEAAISADIERAALRLIRAYRERDRKAGHPLLRPGKKICVH